MSSRNIPAWTRGTFSVCFFYVGQGDCALVKFPDGRVMMIDGGSSSDFDPDADLRNIRGVLESWTGGARLHFLVLTHPDQDHYNKLVKILEGYDTEVVMMSCANDTGTGYPTSPYRVSNLSGYLRWPDWGVEYIIDVSVNRIGDVVTIWSADDWRNPLDLADEDVRAELPDWIEDQLNDDGQLEDPFFTVASGNSWDVSIIAGNVGLGNFGNRGAILDAQKNMASLVTRLTIQNVGFDRALFHGDADHITQQYLYDKRARLNIEDVDLCQASHHGSLTGYLDRYIDWINPANVVVSVALGEYNFRLPDHGVVAGYLDLLENQNIREVTVEEHDIDYWEVFMDDDPVWNIIQDWLDNDLEVRLNVSNGRGVRRAVQADIDKKVWGRYTVIEDYANLAPNSFYMAIPAMCKALYTASSESSLQETGRAITQNRIVNFQITGR